jgi:hypothetical protein
MSVQQDVVGWAAIRIDRVVTSGMWRFDGQQVPVDNNVWLLGDNHEILVIDASHDLGPVREAIAGRRVFGIACGPVRTGQSHSDFATIIAQPKRKLSLPPQTRILPGHDNSTTLIQESPYLAHSITRGY